MNTGHPSGMTPLHGAAEWGQVAMVKWLLGQGARVDATAKWGLTPLHQATYRGHREAVEVLLEHGADVNARTRDGETPVGIALVRALGSGGVA